MPIEIKKPTHELDLLTPENEKYFVKLIFFKQHHADLRWHICLPEMTNLSGFVAFCGLNCWSAIDTRNRKRLVEMMDKTKTTFCERCAEEFSIALPALEAQGYLNFERK